MEIQEKEHQVEVEVSEEMERKVKLEFPDKENLKRDEDEKTNEDKEEKKTNKEKKKKKHDGKKDIECLELGELKMKLDKINAKMQRLKEKKESVINLINNANEKNCLIDEKP